MNYYRVKNIIRVHLKVPVHIFKIESNSDAVYNSLWFVLALVFSYYSLNLRSTIFKYNTWWNKIIRLGTKNCTDI